MTWTRRAFVQTAGTALGLALLPPWWPDSTGPRLAIIGAEGSDDFGRGALLGIEEAGRAAELLRRPLEFLRLAPVGPADVPSLVERLTEGKVLGVVAALSDQAQRRLEEEAGGGLVVVDGRATRPGERGRPGVFRTGLPAKAYEVAPARAGIPAGRAVLWHAGLYRFGAEQLNERYRRRSGAEMTGAAWAGWMGVKALAEAALRAREGGRAALVERLAGAGAAFDGHKGAALSFTAPGGTLAQPFYVIDGEKTEEVAWPFEEEAG